MRRHLPRVLRLIAVVTVLAGFASQAHAQQRVGVRAGVSAQPDQFYLGLHVETSPIVDRLRFRPNIEIGLGDDVTLAAFNVEFTYPIPLQNSLWSLYVGGGPALNITDVHTDSQGSGETKVGGGFNILVGLVHGRRFFTELKVGALDSAELKFGVGMTF